MRFDSVQDRSLSEQIVCHVLRKFSVGLLGILTLIKGFNSRMLVLEF